MSQMPKPLFEPGDHVRYTAPGGCQILMKVGTVHHPSGTGDGYRYDGFEVDHPGSVYQITGAPEKLLEYMGRPLEIRRLMNPQHAVNYQVVVDDDMIDRYINKAIEYGTFESLPPYRDRVRGLLRSALGQA